MKVAMAKAWEAESSPHSCAPALRSIAPSPKTRVEDHAVTSISPSLQRAWQALAEDASEPNCFAEPWLCGAGIRHLSDGAEVRLIEVWSGDRLIGILPLCISREYGRMSVAHVANWLHPHHYLGTPCVRVDHEQSFWSAVLAHLDQAKWAPGFLHLIHLVEEGAVLKGLQAAAESRGRTCPIVHRSIRAMLESHLSPDLYYERTVRKKKRKELKRLSSRLAELGQLSCRTLEDPAELGTWTEEFLRLERSGWKGRASTALSCAQSTEAFFREVVIGAMAADRLHFLRLDLDGRPIAMLVNFIAPPGGFSFKIAFDEDYARFSPGVLIELENLQILRRPDVAWMDSCASAGHPMIDRLWGERRTLVRATVRLAGLRRGLTYRVCRALEKGSAARRKLFSGLPQKEARQ